MLSRPTSVKEPIDVSTTEHPAPTRGSSVASSRTWLLLAMSVAVGLVGGVLTSFGQTVLPAAGPRWPTRPRPGS